MMPRIPQWHRPVQVSQRVCWLALIVAVAVMATDFLLTARGVGHYGGPWIEGNPLIRALLLRFGASGLLLIAAQEVPVLTILLFAGRSVWLRGAGLGFAIGMIFAHGSGALTWL